MDIEEWKWKAGKRGMTFLLRISRGKSVLVVGSILHSCEKHTHIPFVQLCVLFLSGFK